MTELQTTFPLTTGPMFRCRKHGVISTVDCFACWGKRKNKPELSRFATRAACRAEMERVDSYSASVEG